MDDLVWSFMQSNEFLILEKNGKSIPFSQLKQSFQDYRFLIDMIKEKYCSLIPWWRSELTGHNEEESKICIPFQEGAFASFSIEAFNQQVTLPLLKIDKDGRSISMAICEAILKVKDIDLLGLNYIYLNLTYRVREI